MGRSELDKVNMGLRIRSAREQRGKTRQMFAEELGMSVNALSNIELGHSGTQLENLIKICKFLGLSADYVLFGETTGRDSVQRIMELLGHQDEKRLQAIERAIRAMLEAMQP